jgi:hypothetical protein
MVQQHETEIASSSKLHAFCPRGVDTSLPRTHGTGLHLVDSRFRRRHVVHHSDGTLDYLWPSVSRVGDYS